MTLQPTFFDFAAEVGLTKHIGGLDATAALLDMCRVGRGMRVLDVGCGVGVTPVFLAKRYRCAVVGVDVSPKMVERSRQRVARERLGDAVEIRQADGQALPFGAGEFDAVITESVTVFAKDKRRAVGEYARVTKRGGYVGLNESVWLKVPPPSDVVAWVSQDAGAHVQPLSADAWAALLRDVGLEDVVCRTHRVDAKAEARGILGRYGLRETLLVVGRMLLLYARSPAYRAFVKRVRSGGVTPPSLPEYFGYGLFVGRKVGQVPIGS